MASAHDFNPETGLSREQYRDNWMSSGIGNIDQMRDWLSRNGGQILSDNGTVMTPYGDVLDMGTAFRTGNGSAGWTPVNSMMQQSQGSQFNPAQNNNSVLGNAGSGNFLGNILAALQNGGFGAQMFNQPQSAMPYNPSMNENRGQVSNYWSQRPIPTGQTDGTLLGTSFSFGPSNQGSSGQNNMQSGMNQPQSQTQRTPMNAMTPMGAPSFYQNRNENFEAKPLPSNNLQGNF